MTACMVGRMVVLIHKACCVGLMASLGLCCGGYSLLMGYKYPLTLEGYPIGN